ncbi:MAG: amino acid adenylation protein [Bryobacterales bacterium]|nr:amino acid adenylation protein [Bryobacterales bacterium]
MTGDLEGIAIIGMAGRFPGASTPEAFWKNLVAGVESIERFAPGELEVSPSDPALSKPNYIRARSILRDVDLFEPEFFGIYPTEAEFMDPQHRVFLECCWEAFENAGYDPARISGLAGVFAGCSPNTYFLTQLCAEPDFARNFAADYQVGQYTTMLGAIADTLATRVSYKLNLRGPSITVLSACSTSLVAVAQACQSLLTYQCDMALAGAVSITLPQKRGYLHQEGGMVSADGHCRTFDEAATGTVFGSGAGVVLLKRLEDALADRDHIYAVIRGSAVNNDGAGKVGFTAPGVDGQAQVIGMAQAAAGVTARSIEYIEAHGTATPLGDPIELAALTRAFRQDTSDKAFCALGTAKTNVGHLDVAAGVTGLIKTALSLQNEKLPPVLHFRKPNPHLKIAGSPFFVNSELRQWPRRSDTPRRAGVSAFGVGGTNAHVVLEEAPTTATGSTRRSVQLITISARSASALAKKAAQLSEALIAVPDASLADIAYTLASGRRAFPIRWSTTAETVASASERLLQFSTENRQAAPAREGPSVCFLFPGQGSQQVNMGRELFESEPVFRQAVMAGARFLTPFLGLDICGVLYPSEGELDSASERLRSTAFAQPALFVVEYALAKLWEHWGIKPAAMIGHSLGEFVAACLAGVFSFEDGLRMVAERGRMMEGLRGGGMRAIHLAAADVEALLRESEFAKLSLAAVNAPHLCVVAGDHESLIALESRLAVQKIASQPLATSRAFHSCMVEPILEPLRDVVRTCKLEAPRTTVISSVTGDVLSPAEATDPEYWVRHCRQTVQFSRAFVCATQAMSFEAFLEVGPGTVMQGLARAHTVRSRNCESTTAKSAPLLLCSLGQTGRSENHAARGASFHSLGQLWEIGGPVDWAAFFEDEERRRVPLPTYPFERKRYWLERRPITDTRATAAPAITQTQHTQEDGTNTPTTPGDASSAVHELADKEDTMTPSKESVTPRAARYTAELAALVSDLSGVEPGSLTPDATFLELGFDSLFLTQVAQAVNGRYGVSVTFRQLLDQFSTLESIGAFLAETLPPDVVAIAAPEFAGQSGAGLPVSEALGAAPVFIAGSAGSPTGLESVLREQLQAMTRLMDRQLELLGQHGKESLLPKPQSASVAGLNPVAQAQTRDQAPTAVPEFKPFGPYKPAQRSAGGEITPAQRHYIAAFTQKVNSKTAQSKAYAQRYRKVLADPRAVSGFRQQWKDLVYPIVTERSKGSRLWDLDGNEYLDLLNGFGPIAFGHKPDFVVDALKQQLDLGIEIGPQTPLAGPTAELLCELTGMDRANNGEKEKGNGRIMFGRIMKT